MQIARLFETVYILLQKGNVTAKQLSERLGVSERTVYRDLDLLSGAGIPVYASQGKGGGIRLLDGFVLDKSLLTMEDQQEILAALQSLQAVGSDTGSALAKLGAVFHQNAQSWVEVDFSNWGPSSRERFQLLKEAVLQRKVISFDYYSSRGEKTSRQAEPLQLWFKDRAWFLKAYCRTKEAFRIFKISRMKNIVIRDIPFSRQLSDMTYDESAVPVQIISFKLHIDAAVAYRVYDEFDESEIQPMDDGSFTVSASFPEGDWVYGYILSFGSSVEVLEPDSMRKEIAARIDRMRQKYL
ncbi:MAG: YafY family protein [Eubacteriales bacterium]